MWVICTRNLKKLDMLGLNVKNCTQINIFKKLVISLVEKITFMCSSISFAKITFIITKFSKYFFIIYSITI